MEIIEMHPIKTGQHKLPPLPYKYDGLEPIIDAKTVDIHYNFHHRAYVEDLNKTELALEKARETNFYDYIKYLEGQLAFNGSGHILHSIYWTVMTKEGTGGEPNELLESMINSYFGTFDRFKQQFILASLRVQGSGWGILGYNPSFQRLEILQCEKHQNLTQWGIIPILVCDVWEHAYYLKYQNDRKTFIEKWWNLINWKEVNSRLLNAIQCKVLETE